MTRRRVHLPPERIGPARAELTEEARHYLRDVLRLAPGAPVELFDGRGGAWEATIEPGFAALALGARREALAAGPAITLLFALAKGEKNDLVVQKATELGVARLCPWSAERSVVKLDAAKGRERAERWRRIAEEAARQCGRADVPEVEAPAGRWAPRWRRCLPATGWWCSTARGARRSARSGSRRRPGWRWWSAPRVG